MVCTTVTVVQAKPVVSNLVATPRPTQTGVVDLSWTQDIVGSVVIKVDGVVVGSGIYGSYTTTLTGLTVSTHTICVDAL